MKSYKVQRKSIVGVAIENYPKTIKSLASLVACGGIGPVAYVQVYNSDFLMNSMLSDIFLGGTLLFFAFSASYIGFKIYQNFKEERGRVQELVQELEFEKTMKQKGFITPDELSKINFQKQIERDNNIIDIENYLNTSENNSSFLGKRKSLTTAPFKNSDNL